MAYNLLAGFIRALGNSRQPFYFLIFSAIINILLDIVFILIMGMGVEGAGIATLLSQAFSSMMCLWYIRKHLTILIPQGEERHFNNKRIAILLNNGVPMGLQFSITGIGIIMLQSANNALGTLYVASFTAAMRVKYLFICVFDNIGVSMATYCGQNIGAEKTERIQLGIRSALMITAVYFVLTVIVIYPFADQMMALFVNSGEQDVIKNAAYYMRISNYFYPALGLLTIFRYSIQGLGYSMLSMLSGVMEMIARCGVSIWPVPELAFTGVCFADPTAWMAADLFLIPAYFYLYKKIKRDKAHKTRAEI
jgi:MATE efflux family protein